MYEAAGLLEPGLDDEQARPNWRFADVMDLGDDEEGEEEIESEGEDMVIDVRKDMKKTKNPVIPSPTTTSIDKFFPSSPIVARDVFGRVITGFQAFQQPTATEKEAMRFKARAILAAAFQRSTLTVRLCIHHEMFKVFAKSNPLGMQDVERELFDCFNKTSSELRDAFPATTLDKFIKGHIIKLKCPAEDGTTKLRLFNVSASRLWSGWSGIHTEQDKKRQLLRFDTLSPEEIHLGDYYHHSYSSRAPHQFVHFPLLPPHVQDQIWEFSFEPRVVEIHYTPDFARIWSPAKWPPQCLVSKECNAVMRRKYDKFPFGAATTTRGLLFNFNIDIMFLTYEKERIPPTMEYMPVRARKVEKLTLSFLRSIPRAQIEKVRHLALDRGIWDAIEIELNKLRKRRRKVSPDEKYILPMFTGLQSMQIVQNLNVGIWRMNKRPWEDQSREDLVPYDDDCCGFCLDCDCYLVDEWIDRLASCCKADSSWWKCPLVMFIEMQKPEYFD